VEAEAEAGTVHEAAEAAAEPEAAAAEARRACVLVVMARVAAAVCVGVMARLCGVVVGDARAAARGELARDGVVEEGFKRGVAGAEAVGVRVRDEGGLERRSLDELLLLASGWRRAAAVAAAEPGAEAEEEPARPSAGEDGEAPSDLRSAAALPVAVPTLAEGGEEGLSNADDDAAVAECWRASEAEEGRLLVLLVTDLDLASRAEGGEGVA